MPPLLTILPSDRVVTTPLAAQAGATTSPLDFAQLYEILQAFIASMTHVDTAQLHSVFYHSSFLSQHWMVIRNEWALVTESLNQLTPDQRQDLMFPGGVTQTQSTSSDLLASGMLDIVVLRISSSLTHPLDYDTIMAYESVFLLLSLLLALCETAKKKAGPSDPTQETWQIVADATREVVDSRLGGLYASLFRTGAESPEAAAEPAHPLPRLSSCFVCGEPCEQNMGHPSFYSMHTWLGGGHSPSAPGF
jgi:hypothetical protein